MATSNRSVLNGFPAVQEPRDAPRSVQQTVINIRERLRLIEAQLNLGVVTGKGTGAASRPGGASDTFVDAPADDNIYGRQNNAWAAITASGTKFSYAVEPPANENNAGDEWLDATTGTLFTWIDDGDTQQWVEWGPGYSGSISGETSTLQFPENPSDGTPYSFQGRSWVWNARGWVKIESADGVTSLNTLTGAVALEAGDNITITPLSGNALQVSGRAGGVSQLLVDDTSGGAILFDDSGDVLYEDTL